jgi:hypothetical protein
MVDVKVKVKLKPREGIDAKRVKRSVDRSTFRNLGHAGGAIRLIARRSIRKSKTASTPGTAPHTRQGQLKRAVVYAVEKSKQKVVIGPTHELVGPSAMAHEFGGRFRGDQYPKRPLMGPALEKSLDRLPKFWTGSVR